MDNPTPTRGLLMFFFSSPSINIDKRCNNIPSHRASRRDADDDDNQVIRGSNRAAVTASRRRRRYTAITVDSFRVRFAEITRGVRPCRTTPFIGSSVFRVFRTRRAPPVPVLISHCFKPNPRREIVIALRGPAVKTVRDDVGGVRAAE